MKINSFNEFLNEDLSAIDLQQSYRKGYAQGDIDATSSMVKFAALGFAIGGLIRLIAIAKKRYKLNVMLKGETDPVKREKLKSGIQQLTDEEFNLKYKIKRREEKIAKKTARSSTSDMPLSPKEQIKLEKQKGKLEALMQQYKELTGEIEQEERENLSARRMGRRF